MEILYPVAYARPYEAVHMAKFLTNTESRTGDALKRQKAMTMPYKE